MPDRPPEQSCPPPRGPEQVSAQGSAARGKGPGAFALLLLGSEHSLERKLFQEIARLLIFLKMMLNVENLKVLYFYNGKYIILPLIF